MDTKNKHPTRYLVYLCISGTIHALKLTLKTWVVLNTGLYDNKASKSSHLGDGLRRKAQRVGAETKQFCLSVTEAAIDRKQTKMVTILREVRVSIGNLVLLELLLWEVRYCTPHKVYHSPKRLHPSSFLFGE